ncbi:MAG: response regulator [Lachnospiraceae bacterium]|nr:response regulator [Lachnospiraceae bacterium]
MQALKKFDDIIFSKFCGPAAVIEYRNGEVNIVAINDKYLEVLKLNIDRQVYLDTRLQDRLDDGNLQVYLNAVKKCIATGEDQKCETRRKMVENCCGMDYVWLKSYMVLLEKGDDVSYIFENIRNITNEKNTLDTLADIEHRYVAASEQLNIYNWEYTIATKEMRPCYRCMRDLGVPAVVENYPEPVIEAGIFPPDYADMYRDYMRRIDAGEAVPEVDIPLTVGRIPFRIRYTTEFDEQGKPVRAFGSAELISESELGRIRLDSIIIDTLAAEDACIYIVEPVKDTMRIVKQEDIFDIKEDATCRELDVYITGFLNEHTEDCEDCRDMSIYNPELFGAGDRRGFVFKDVKSNRWLSLFYRVIERKDDVVTRILITVAEVDTLRAQKLEADKLIAQQKAELEDRQKLLFDAMNAANRANMAKTEFFSNLSHDIRTPMSAINGFSKLAREEIDDREKLEEYLDKIITASDHLMNLINDILDMSRIESGKMELSPTPVRIKNLCGECADMIRDEIKEKGLNFTLDIDGLGEDTVKCDKLRFRQVILNLLSNAYKFTPKGGNILLAGKLLDSKDKLTYEIRVKDTGIGMSPEFKEHIWEAFAREDKGAVHETQGTGLGMAIVKSIVNLMQGTVDLKTEQGKGSEFIIVLPLEPAQGSTEESAEDAAVREAMSRNYEGRTIFVVDDTATNVKLAEYVLGKFGFKVRTANCGIDAVETVRNSKPGDIDLILMDVAMPVMNGLEATRRIRALENPELASIPIIAMTANAFESDIKAALAAGMNAHVPKPFRREDLITKIAENLK